MVSDTKERSPDAEQAAILGRLLVDHRRPRGGGWVRWLLQLVLFLALVWIISLFKQACAVAVALGFPGT